MRPIIHTRMGPLPLTLCSLNWPINTLAGCLRPIFGAPSPNKKSPVASYMGPPPHKAPCAHHLCLNVTDFELHFNLGHKINQATACGLNAALNSRDLGLFCSQTVLDRPWGPYPINGRLLDFGCAIIPPIDYS